MFNALSTFKNNALSILGLSFVGLLLMPQIARGQFVQPTTYPDETTSPLPVELLEMLAKRDSLEARFSSLQAHHDGQQRDYYIIAGEERDSSTVEQAYLDSLLATIAKSPTGNLLVENAIASKTKIYVDTLQTGTLGYYQSNSIGHKMVDFEEWSPEETFASDLSIMTEELVHCYQDNVIGGIEEQPYLKKHSPETRLVHKYFAEASAKTISALVIHELNQNGMPNIVSDVDSAYGGEDYHFSSAVNFLEQELANARNEQDETIALAKTFYKIIRDDQFRSLYFDIETYALENSTTFYHLNGNSITFQRYYRVDQYMVEYPENLLKAFGQVPGREINFIENFKDLSSSSFKPYTPSQFGRLYQYCSMIPREAYDQVCTSDFYTVGNQPIGKDLHQAWKANVDTLIENKITLEKYQELAQTISQLDVLKYSARYVSEQLDSLRQDSSSSVSTEKYNSELERYQSEYKQLLSETEPYRLPWRHLINHPEFNGFIESYELFENSYDTAAVRKELQLVID